MLALTSSAAAFTAPLAPRATGAGISMKKSAALPFVESPAHLEGMIGNVGFDPLGLSTPQNIKWMREAELEHGRLCMLAWTGYTAVDCGIRFPGEKYAALNSFHAHDATARGELFLLLLLVGTAETIKFSQVLSPHSAPSRIPPLPALRSPPLVCDNPRCPPHNRDPGTHTCPSTRTHAGV